MRADPFRRGIQKMVLMATLAWLRPAKALHPILHPRRPSLSRLPCALSFYGPSKAGLAMEGSFQDSKSLVSTRLFSSRGADEDSFGRRVRRRPESSSSWDNNEDDWSPPRKSNQGWGEEDDGWGETSSSTRRRSGRARDTYKTNDVDENDAWDPNYTPKPRASRRQSYRDEGSSSSRRPRASGGRNDFQNRGHNRRSQSQGSFRRNGGRPSSNQSNDKSSSRSINMNALEGAGFVHLYGLSSILNALQANRRDLTTIHERSSTTEWFDDENEDLANSSKEESLAPKPQAQFRPYLFVQEGRNSNTRKGQKASDAEKVMALAAERNVPIEEVDKGILNTLSGNRPHQGFVLRCGKLYFESLSQIPVSQSQPSLWLVLDEVVDPQNLGAILRSAYFLGQGRLGVLVCSKNSAPPTPVVSASSAGALELLTVYSTNNLPRTLNQAKEDGFRIIGASSSVPTIAGGPGDGQVPPPLYDLQELPLGNSDDRPTILVLGSEGHGIRTLVAKACTEFVRIPAGVGLPEPGDTNKDADLPPNAVGVDSLNVSVTGGILLWQLLSGRG